MHTTTTHSEAFGAGPGRAPRGPQRVKLLWPVKLRRKTNHVVKLGGTTDKALATRRRGHRARALAIWQRQLAMDAQFPRTRAVRERG